MSLSVPEFKTIFSGQYYISTTVDKSVLNRSKHACQKLRRLDL